MPVRIRDVSCPALLDSGNLWSTCMSRELFDQLGFTQEDLDPNYQPTKVGTAREGESLSILGRLRRFIHIRLGTSETKLKCRPAVVNDLSMPLNLSASFLKQHSIDQLHGKGKIRVKGKEIPLFTRKDFQPGPPVRLTQSVQVREDTVVPPFQECCVKLRLDTKHNGLSIVTGSFNFMDSTNLHPVRNALVNVTQGECLGTVLNTTPEAIVIKTGTMFGEAQLACLEGQSCKFPGHQMIAEIAPTSSKSKEKDRLTESWAYGPTTPTNLKKRQAVLDQRFNLKSNQFLKEPRLYLQALKLFLKFWECFSFDGSFGSCDLLYHEIHTEEGPPIHQRIRPINPALEESLQKQIQEWLEQDVIEPSISPWNFALVPVPKKDGRTRWCIDYRQLNERTVKDRHPIGDISDNLNQLNSSSIFSVLDGTGAFHVVPLSKEAKPKTAFSTPSGHYQFKRLPFGLSNGPATYCRLVQLVLQGLPRSRVVPYLDDIICHSQTPQEHLQVLEQVFQAYSKAGLRLQPHKCHFFQERINYLGHMVSQKGVEPSASHVSIIKDWPLPLNRTQVRAFLGKIGYYRRFIRDFAALARPLMDQLSLENGKDDKEPFTPTPEYQKSFVQLKEALLTAPILAYPVFDSPEPFILDTDWSQSNGSIGAVLSQVQEGKERVIAYAAKRLNAAQRNYAPTKGELLGAVVFMKHFSYYLRHRPFILRTDHKALLQIKTMEPPLGTIGRWLDCISNFDFKVVYREGKKHGNADALSRADFIPIQDTVEDHGESVAFLKQLSGPKQLVKAQEEDPHLSIAFSWLDQNRTPSKEERKAMPFELLGLAYLRSSLLRNKDGVLCVQSAFCPAPRPVWPSKWCKALILQSHEKLAHKGAEATAAFVSERVYMPGLLNKVKFHLGQCNACLTKTKPSSRGQHSQLHSHKVSDPWHTLSIDFVGPFPPSVGNFRYLLTVKDLFTRWLEAFPTRDMTTTTVIKILQKDIFARYGYCQRIYSDNGPQFASDLFHKMGQKLGIDVVHTPPYNPRSNPVERSHRDLEASLTALCKNQTNQWTEFLPHALFAQRIAVCRSTGLSPFQMMFGRVPRCELDLLFPLPSDLHQTPQDFAEKLFDRQQRMFQLAREKTGVTIQRQRTAYHGRLARFKEGQLVWLFVPRPPKQFVKLAIWWTGPWVVKTVLNPLTYEVQFGEKLSSKARTEIVAVDRLRPYFHDTVVTPPQNLNPVPGDPHSEHCFLPAGSHFSLDDSNFESSIPYPYEDDPDLSSSEPLVPTPVEPPRPPHRRPIPVEDPPHGAENDSHDAHETSESDSDSGESDGSSDSDDHALPPSPRPRTFSRIRQRVGPLPDIPDHPPTARNLRYQARDALRTLNGTYVNPVFSVVLTCFLSIDGQQQ